MSTYPGQNPSLTFPSSPGVGDDYVADNGATYIWTGAYWSSALAVVTGRAEPILDGEYASSTYDSYIDKSLDGGGA
jgi:hypothetical protein